MKKIKALKKFGSQSSYRNSPVSHTLGNEKDSVAGHKGNGDLLYEILSGSFSPVANEIMAEIEFSDDNS